MTTTVAGPTRVVRRRVWARVAGLMFILYIALGMAGLSTSGPVSDALNYVVLLVSVLLAVSLFAVTVDVVWWLAVIALVLRATEGFATAYWDQLGGQLLFAVGSTIFAYLFVRGRLVPLPLAYLGLAASVLLFVSLPLGGGSFSEPITWIGYMPMLVFELTLGVWLIVKGVPERQAS